MTRAVRNSRLESAVARAQLQPSGKPYYHAIDQGLHLGYRKGIAGGSWVIRRLAGNGKYVVKTIAVADDHCASDGAGVLDFWQAQRRACDLPEKKKPALTFVTPLPGKRTEKRGARRAAIVAAIKATKPDIAVTLSDVTVHVLAEVPRAHLVADVDNLLKPVLDAMAGVIYQNDTQVAELSIKRAPGPALGRLTNKVWGSEAQ